MFRRRRNKGTEGWRKLRDE